MLRLVAAGADCNEADALGRTAIIYLVRVGTLATLEVVLLAGAGVDAADAEGQTALMLAAIGKCVGRAAPFSPLPTLRAREPSRASFLAAPRARHSSLHIKFPSSGRWVCACGKAHAPQAKPSGGHCACGGKPPCYFWIRSRCTEASCRWPHAAFELEEPWPADAVVRPPPNAFLAVTAAPAAAAPAAAAFVAVTAAPATTAPAGKAAAAAAAEAAAAAKARKAAAAAAPAGKPAAAPPAPEAAAPAAVPKPAPAYKVVAAVPVPKYLPVQARAAWAAAAPASPSPPSPAALPLPLAAVVEPSPPSPAALPPLLPLARGAEPTAPSPGALPLPAAAAAAKEAAAPAAGADADAWSRVPTRPVDWSLAGARLAPALPRLAGAAAPPLGALAPHAVRYAPGGLGAAAVPFAPAAPAPAAAAPAPAAAQRDWPPGLQEYVARCFRAAPPAQHPLLQPALRAVMDAARARGELWTRDWAAEPPPDLGGAAAAAASLPALALAPAAAHAAPAPPAPLSPRDDECAVCMERPTAAVAVPCGHKVCCSACARLCRAAGHVDCVYCREPLSGWWLADERAALAAAEPKAGAAAAAAAPRGPAAARPTAAASAAAARAFAAAAAARAAAAAPPPAWRAVRVVSGPARRKLPVCVRLYVNSLFTRSPTTVRYSMTTWVGTHNVFCSLGTADVSACRARRLFSGSRRRWKIGGWLVVGGWFGGGLGGRGAAEERRRARARQRSAPALAGLGRHRRVRKDAAGAVRAESVRAVVLAAGGAAQRQPLAARRPLETSRRRSLAAI